MKEERINQLLQSFGGQFVFYAQRNGKEPFLLSNAEENFRFRTASIIKTPLLLAWLNLERDGVVSSDEICPLKDEAPVYGAGFSYLMETSALSYRDVLLMMIATSDNLCTNAIIEKLGFDLINRVFSEKLGLADTHLGRKMMSKADAQTGRDNWTIAGDMIRWFDLIEALPKEQKKFMEERLLACEENRLFLRNIKGDAFDFYHKSGGLHHVIAEWGYTRDCRIFLMTNHFSDYQSVYDAFGWIGKAILADGEEIEVA